MSETDEQFLGRLEEQAKRANNFGATTLFRPTDIPRLFDLARRGAAVQWRPIQEDYEGEVLLWPRGSAVPSHFMPLPPPPAGETNE